MTILELHKFRFISQGALKLKISMKAQKKDETDKSKCEKSRKIGTRKAKLQNNGVKVILQKKMLKKYSAELRTFGFLNLVGGLCQDPVKRRILETNRIYSIITVL